MYVCLYSAKIRTRIPLPKKKKKKNYLMPAIQASLYTSDPCLLCAFIYPGSCGAVVALYP